jgi:hypothetical protein
MVMARWEETIVDEAGNILALPTIEVKREIAGQPIALLFSDRAGSIAIGNPFVGNADGSAAFHVAGGAYQVTISKGAFVKVLRYVRVGTAGEKDVDQVGIPAAVAFTFDNPTTDADPGAGRLRLNNATPASATALYVDNLSFSGADVQAWLDTFDDNGLTGNRGYLHLYHPASPNTNWRIYKVTGTIVDGTGYRKVTIAHISGAGSFTDEELIHISFQQVGPTGSFTALADNTGFDDDSGNEHTRFRKIASAVNYIEQHNAATGTGPKFKAAGDDTNVDLLLEGKGTGRAKTQGEIVLGGGAHVIGYWPARALVRPTTTPAGALAQEESTTNKVNDEYNEFADGSTTHLQLSFRAPKGLNEGSTLDVEIEWKEAAGASTHVCRWQAEAQAQSDADTIDAGWGTAVAVDDTGTSGTRRFALIAAVTPGGTWAVNDKIIVRIARLGGHANDTLNVGARLLGVTVIASLNKINDA